MMLNWIISSSLLIVAVIILRFALRGKVSPNLSYALWLVVLLRLLMPFSVMHVPYSAASLVESTQLSQDLERLEQVTRVEHMSDGEIIGYVKGFFHLDGTPATDAYTQIAENADEEEFARWQRSSNVKNFGKNILRPAWIAGIVLVAAWFTFINAVFTRRLHRTRQRLACDCPRPVYISTAVETPCLHGLISPTIYVTPAVAADETALRHVLSHELSHYRHGDHIWGIFRAAVLALHWYNPLVWWAVALSRRDGELACDESAIALLGESQRTDYGRTLIGLSCRGGGRDLLLNATTMTGSKRGLRERIVLIAQKPQTKAAAVFFAAVIVIFAAVFTFAGSVPGSSYIRASSAEPTNEDFRLRYDRTITHVRLICDVYQDGELLKVEDRVLPASAVEHINIEPRLKGLDTYDYDIVVTIDGSMSKQEIVFDVTTGYTFELYGWSTPNMPEPVKLAVGDSVMLMILRAGGYPLGIPAGDELTANMLRFRSDRTASIRLEFYGDEKSARDQGSGNAYENPLTIAADNLHRYGNSVFMACENGWDTMDDNISLYTRYRFGNLQQATLSVKYYQKGQLMQEANLPYDLRLSRYACNLTPTPEGWRADATAYDYALTRPTDTIGVTIPVSGTPQVQNRYGNDLGEWGHIESSLKLGQTYCLATAVWGDSVSRWGGEYEDNPELIAEAEHLVLYELTVEAHGGNLYGEYMSGVRPLYIHLPPELTKWELPNKYGEGVITGASVVRGGQGYMLTEDEYLEMTENGTDASTILFNRRYWAMEYANYVPEWVQSSESVTGTGDLTGAIPEWTLRVAAPAGSTSNGFISTFANDEIICTSGALTLQNHNDFPVWGSVWIGEEDRANFGKTAGSFALNPGEWVTLHDIASNIIHSVSFGAMVEEDTEMTLTVLDHDACHDE